MKIQASFTFSLLTAWDKVSGSILVVPSDSSASDTDEEDDRSREGLEEDLT